MGSSNLPLTYFNLTSIVLKDPTDQLIVTNWTTTTLDQLKRSSTISTQHFINKNDNINEPIVSNDLRKLFEVINFVVLSGVISFFGSIGNVISIVIFVKQGLSDPVNISLLGLSVSDLGALLTLIWMSICFNPLFVNSGIGFDSLRVQYLTAGWPHVCCARITSWITAFVTFERCMCITMPLKVKTMITPTRTAYVIISIFVVMVASVSPVYYAISLGSVVDETTNISRISLVYRPNGPKIENVSFAINTVAQLSAVVFVIVCTIVLVHNLLHNFRWRRTLASTCTTKKRDKRRIKMIISLSVIFIVCFLPSAVNLIVMILTPDYSIVGKQANMFQVGWSFLNTLEATNSSVNIIIYYRMSSRYRIFFRRLFGIKDVDRNFKQDAIATAGHDHTSNTGHDSTTIEGT